MTPKEKAENLFRKIYDITAHVDMQNTVENAVCRLALCKLALIIVVDEILNCIQTDTIDFEGSVIDEIDAESYWEEVKKEIKKL